MCSEAESPHWDNKTCINEATHKIMYRLAVADTSFCDGSGYLPPPTFNVSLVNNFFDALSGIPGSMVFEFPRTLNQYTPKIYIPSAYIAFGGPIKPIQTNLCAHGPSTSHHSLYEDHSVWSRASLDAPWMICWLSVRSSKMQQKTSGYKLRCRICITSGRIPYAGGDVNGTVWIAGLGFQYQG